MSKRTVVTAAMTFCFASAALAQLNTGFEPPDYAGSRDGTILTGQNGWYIPVTPSADFNLYAHADNALNIPANPCGGDFFAAGFAGGTNPVARAELGMTFPDGEVLISTDFLADHSDVVPVTNNVGSLSLNPNAGGPTYTNQTFILLFSWVDVNNPSAGYNAFYLHHNADGTQVAQPGSQPGPEWGGLQLNTWYRLKTWVDFRSNKIVRVSIQDVSGDGSETIVNVTSLDWWLAGGSAGGLPLPTAIRMFAGGTADNPNIAAYDNLHVDDASIPFDPCSDTNVAADMNCDGLVNNFDIDPFVLALSDAEAYEAAFPDCDVSNADVNGDGLVNNFDIDPFVACVANGGCP